MWIVNSEYGWLFVNILKLKSRWEKGDRWRFLNTIRFECTQSRLLLLMYMHKITYLVRWNVSDGLYTYIYYLYCRLSLLNRRKKTSSRWTQNRKHRNWHNRKMKEIDIDFRWKICNNVCSHLGSMLIEKNFPNELYERIADNWVPWNKKNQNMYEFMYLNCSFLSLYRNILHRR